MTKDRIQAIEKAITEQGNNWTNRSIYAEVGGHYPSTAQYLKDRRAQSLEPQQPLTSAAVPTHPPRTRLPRLTRQQEYDRLVSMAPLTIKMIEWCETCMQGTFYPYTVMNQALGVNVQLHLKKLRTARSFLLDRDHKCFDLLPNKGILWVTESGKLPVITRNREMAYNKLRKNVRLGGSVDLDILPVEDRPQWVAAMSSNAAAALAIHAKTVEKIIAQKKPQPLLIDPREYQDYFQGMLSPSKKGQK